MTEINEKLKSNLLAYAESHRAEFFDDIKALCRIDSTQGEALPGMPYGAGPDMALRAMAELYEKNGAKAEIHSDRGYALVRFFDENKPNGCVGAFTHCDVVLPNGEWLYTTPYEPVEKDGLLIGRGVKDDKGGGVLMLYAIKALNACGYQFKHAYQGFLGANEETGFGCVKNYLADGCDIPLLSLSPDASYAVVPGETSKFSIFVRCRKAFENVIDFDHGGSKGVVCPNMKLMIKYSDSLWRELSMACEGREDASLSREEGFIELKTTGKSVHIAAPHHGVHAGGAATEILLQCPSIGESDMEIIKALDPIFRQMKCEPYACAFDDPLFGPSSSGMLSVHTDDGHLEMEGRLNYSLSQDTKQLEEAVCGYYEDRGWDCEIKDQSDGYVHTGRNAEILQKIDDVYTELNGGRCDKRKAFGATYSRYVKNCFSTGLEVPYTKKPVDFPEGHGPIHRPDECVDMDAFIKGIAATAMHLVIIDSLA